MSLQRKIAQRKERRTQRVRKKVVRCGRVRISVFKSAKHIYGQAIDDEKNHTIESCSTIELKDMRGNKTEVARKIGLELAKKIRKKGIEVASFDRGPFLYHGRVKAFAEGLREGGIII